MGFCFDDLSLRVLTFSLQLRRHAICASAHAYYCQLRGFFTRLIRICGSLGVVCYEAIVRNCRAGLFAAATNASPSFRIGNHARDFTFRCICGFYSFGYFRICVFVLEWSGRIDQLFRPTGLCVVQGPPYKTHSLRIHSSGTAFRIRNSFLWSQRGVRSPIWPHSDPIVQGCSKQCNCILDRFQCQPNSCRLHLRG